MFPAGVERLEGVGGYVVAERRRLGRWTVGQKSVAAAFALILKDPVIGLPGSQPGSPGGQPIIIEPPPGSEVSVQSVSLGNIVMGPTIINMDSRPIARAVASAFIEDVTILDQLGKALGKRKAVTS